MSESNDLRMMADAYMQMQKMRIRLGNQKFASEDGADEITSSDSKVMSKWKETLQGIEEEMVGEMTGPLHQHATWPWLKTIKGVGPILSCKILALIDDISKFDTISHLWSFAGYGLHPNGDGVQVIQRLTKGEKATFSGRLKTALYLLGESFIKCGGAFSRIYYSAKEHYQITHPEWTDGHRHMAAMRKMAKVFLACLYIYWREAESLPVRPLWVIEHGGHETLYRPEEFSEKGVKNGVKKEVAEVAV